jgi:endonuclease/exonuclease/phosphatase family metal-dependent hydrolase
MPKITLGTFNIFLGGTGFLPADHSGQDVENTLRLIATLIGEHSIDVIGLQEVDKNMIRSGTIDEPSFLQDELSWPARSSQFGRAIFKDGGEYGNAILVNLSEQELTYKDHNVQTIELSKVIAVEDRSAIAIRVDIRQPAFAKKESKKLWFVTTHLGLTFCDWTSQLFQILSWTSEFSFPVIVCGDLNVRERSENGRKSMEYKIMKLMFEEHGFVDLGPFGEKNFTYPNEDETASRKVDYMFLRDDRNWFSVYSMERIRPSLNNVWLSDHWALACSLSYQFEPVAEL